MKHILQFKFLKVGIRTKPWIVLLQENLKEFLSTVYLPYIHLAYSLCYTILAYSKEIYVRLKFFSFSFLWLYLGLGFSMTVTWPHVTEGWRRF